MRIRVDFTVTLNHLFLACVVLKDKNQRLTNKAVKKELYELFEYYGFIYYNWMEDSPGLTQDSISSHIEECLDWMSKHWEFDKEKIMKEFSSKDYEWEFE
jgi:hypothetical protein